MLVKWTFQARKELKDTLTYWKNRNKNNHYSIKLNEEVKKIIISIKDNPKIWENIYRALIFSIYALYYFPTEEVIYILPFWDNRRDPDKLKFSITVNSEK